MTRVMNFRVTQLSAEALKQDTWQATHAKTLNPTGRSVPATRQLHSNYQQLRVSCLSTA